MKKSYEGVKTVCDFCGKESYDTCLSCGKDICHECIDKKVNAIEYRFSFHFRGSDDGVYCKECNLKLRNENSSSKIKLQHSAYIKLDQLIKKYELLIKNLNQECDEAEKEIAYWNKN